MPKPQQVNGGRKQIPQRRHQKSTGSDNDDDLNRLSEDVDEDPHVEAKDTMSANSQVSDLRISLRLLTVTKVVVDGRRVKDTTKDLRLCGKVDKGSHPSKNIMVDGWYCKFCL